MQSNTFPSPPSGASSANAAHRGPYPYPYQGSYADTNQTQNPYANVTNSSAPAPPTTLPQTASTSSSSSSAAAMDPVKAERKRAHARMIEELVAKKAARDQAERNVAQMRAQMMNAGRPNANENTYSPRDAQEDEEDVEAKSYDAKRGNAKKREEKTKKKKVLNSTDFLDFDEKFGGRLFNILSVGLVVSALVLFYVLWFTNLVY